MVENIPGISAHDYDLAMLYDALIERYEQVAPHRGSTDDGRKADGRAGWP